MLKGKKPRPTWMAADPRKNVSAARVIATVVTVVNAQANHARKPLAKKHKLI